MFGKESTARLHAVLDEACESVVHREIEAPSHVASKVLEAATVGEVSLGGLR
ncbi:hypothetical protein [Bradyrhizobium japonicum]|uniref:hypothetical protein n=1 Tax=Bradyrhizobium japonicum TaxID=375 RepID=UPI001913C937|nr:hypothetical protein [Bradyrhizobium japonicum]